ncbi:MAG: DMT family transporter [Bacteroidia bacterium]|nr:DMT family transporter [Bacteroidia bacterium]
MKKQILSIPPLTLVWGLVFILAGIWGSSYLLLKKALVVFDPLEVIAGRMCFSALLILPISIKQVRKIPRNKWPAMILFAIMANFLITFLNAVAQSKISSSLNGILSALTPLMTLLVGGIFYATRIRRNQVIGLILGLVGTTILVLFSSEGKFGQVNLYASLAVLAAFFTGLTGNMVRYNLEGLKAIQIASIGFLLILPFAAGYTFYSGIIPTGLSSPEGTRGLIYILVLAVFANLVGILIFTKLINLSSPVFASLVTYLVPIIALCWGLWDGETVNYYQLLGMAVVILSVWLVGRVSTKEKSGPK